MPTEESKNLQSVDKALRVLEVLATERHALPLGELARRLGFHESTAHHLLAAMRRRGFVDQDPQTKAYVLGGGLIQLVRGYVAGMDLYTAGLAPIRELRDHSGETAYLSIRRGGQVIPVIELVGWKPIQCRHSLLEGETNLHATASGKVLLAYLSADESGALLRSSTLPAFTPHTLVDMPRLQVELAAIRQGGIALDREELLDGVMSVAAPVFGADGACAATASVAYPRAGTERTNELIKLVDLAAARVSANLGHVGASARTPAPPDDPAARDAPPDAERPSERPVERNGKDEPMPLRR